MERVMTRHFSLEEWLDYTNRAVDPSKRNFMRHHLESGCTHCVQIAAQWQSLKAFAVKEASLQVPEEAVNAAKLAFNVPGKQYTPSFVEVIGKLIFDSFAQPVFAGARSNMASGTRCLLYEAGPLLIDLNLDVTDGSGRIQLQGQVMDSRVRGKGIEEIPVSLKSGQETITRTETNEFGEFQLECEARKSLQVAVAVNPHRNVLIVLDETVWAARQAATLQ
jgi:hypothetical protein